MRVNIHTHAGRHMYALHDMHTVYKLVQCRCVRTQASRLMRTSSSLSSATCLRLMKTSMCQCCPGVAKTKHTMYNQADKRCILSPPTQTHIPSCQSVEGTHTRGTTREERSPSSMTHHTLLIFKSDKSFEFLASQDGEPDDGLRAFLLVSLAAAAMRCHSC